MGFKKSKFIDIGAIDEYIMSKLQINNLLL